MIKYLFILCLVSVSCISAQEDAVLVLGSGGTKGLAHVGVLEELETMGVKPAAIVGCSSGSLVAALYAQNNDIEEVKKQLMDLSVDDLIELNPFNTKSVSKRKKFEKFLDKRLQVESFAELKTPLVIVATDFATGKSVYFSEGSVKDAVLASCSLPGIFCPFQYDNKEYIDGGLSDPLPIAHACSLNKGKVIASDVSPALDCFKDENIFDVLLKSFEIIYQNLSSQAHHEATVLLEMDFTEGKSPIEDGNNEQFYERGKQIVQEHSQEIHKELGLK